MTSNPQIQLAYNFVQYTNRNIFLTGKAGTGKTTFLRRIKEESPKRMVVVAPTGVAAINAGGVTIHSMFQLPFGPIVPGSTLSENAQRFNKEKIEIIKTMDLLVIDEISMVRADLLDGIDSILRRYRNKLLPFGGVQLLMIGDLQQLAPVAKEEEWNLLKSYYDTPFFFSSRSLKETPTVNIELKHIYRQSDPVFIDMLNKIRNHQIDATTIEQLNKRYIPGFAEKDHEGYIILTTHNYRAKSINDQKLNDLTTRPHIFKADIEGDFPEYSFPTDAALQLKLGAQVMFVKNDTSREKLFYNGKIGIIQKIIEDTIFVKCGEEPLIPVGKQEWNNIKYNIDPTTQEISENITGKFKQYPLKTAWAITIHKSQGLTFEKAIIDAGSSFAHGQVYVALSRCKTLEGMVLSSPIGEASIKDDNDVQSFSKQVEVNQPDEQQLIISKIQYQHNLLFELFNFSTMANRLSYCYRQTGEHAHALHGTLTGVIDTMNRAFKEEITPVSENLLRKMGQLMQEEPDIEKNKQLAERISSGSKWFIAKLETIVTTPLKGTAVISDNKTIKKQVAEALTRLHEELNIKEACLKACTNGFELKPFLDARAKAQLSKPDTKTQQSSSEGNETSSLTINHPKLYARLKTWRNAKAEENNNCPVYLILPTATMAELCNKLPIYMPELNEIKGLGKKKVAMFGREIVEMIMTYRKENNIETTEILSLPTEEKAHHKPSAGSTQEISFRMHSEGKTIDQIAEERGLSPNTIESHLQLYVETGELNISNLVEQHKVDTISDYIITHKPLGLKEVKEALDESFTYAEIKFVRSYLNRVMNE